MLIKKIDEYLNENTYPFHMPGHKRSGLLRNDLGYLRDFTEIEGLDNLNDPKEIFVKMQIAIAKNYRVKDAIISTNGSTNGILAAIRSLSKNNNNLLIERSSHKAVYNAALINKCKLDYIDITTDEVSAVSGIDYDILENKLKNKSYGAVVVTSPSYEGYILDLEKIYGICQKYETKLFVDLAHGSHLYLNDLYKNNFDLAVTSFHKNLSALTPSAALLVNDESLIGSLKESMAIFQTSSPSYLILQSIDEMIENFPKFYRLMDDLNKNLYKLYDLDLKNLKLIDHKDKDRSKILISCKDANVSGLELQEILRKNKIEIEMAYPSYTLLIASIFDDNEAFKYLEEVLMKIDKTLLKADNSYTFTYPRPIKKCELYQAYEREKTIVKLQGAIGKIAGEFIYAYPPGIPILTPGEIIDENTLACLDFMKSKGLSLNIEDEISCLIDKSE